MKKNSLSQLTKKLIITVLYIAALIYISLHLPHQISESSRHSIEGLKLMSIFFGLQFLANTLLSLVLNVSLDGEYNHHHKSWNRFRIILLPILLIVVIVASYFAYLPFIIFEDSEVVFFLIVSIGFVLGHPFGKVIAKWSYLSTKKYH